MTAYVRYGYARNTETLADELLAICAASDVIFEQGETYSALVKRQNEE